MDRAAWRATLHGVTKSQTQLEEHAILSKRNQDRTSGYIEPKDHGGF